MSPLISPRPGRQRGVALIEFALVLPLLLTLLIGTIYYGYVFMLQSAATHAAQAGAAAAVAVSPLGKDLDTYRDDINQAAAAAVAQSLNWLPDSIDDGVVPGADFACSGSGGVACTTTDPTTGSYRVTVTIDIAGGSSPLLPQISLPGIGLVPPVPNGGVLTGSAAVTL